MDKEQIKALALEHGFKLKEQPDGSMDLNPYVYEFAKALANPWVSLSESMPPRATLLDLIDKKGKRRTNYTYMPALDNFRSMVTAWNLHPSDVTHWAIVKTPSDYEVHHAN